MVDSLDQNLKDCFLDLKVELKNLEEISNYQVFNTSVGKIVEAPQEKFIAQIKKDYENIPNVVKQFEDDSEI